MLLTEVSEIPKPVDARVSVAAPKLWNGLLLSIEMSTSVYMFKTRLKTYLFDEALTNM